MTTQGNTGTKSAQDLIYLGDKAQGVTVEQQNPEKL